MFPPHSPSRVCSVLQKNSHFFCISKCHERGIKRHFLLPQLPSLACKTCEQYKDMPVVQSMQPPGVGNLKKYIHIYLYIYIYICINARKTRGPKSLQKEEWNEHMAVTREEECSDPKLETTDSRPGLQNPRARCVRPMQNAPSSGNRFLRERKTETLRQSALQNPRGCQSQRLGRGPGTAACWWGVDVAWHGGKAKGQG